MAKIALLTYLIEGIRLALPSYTVKQVLRMVEVIPLPFASATIMGLINYYGEIIPVINVRRVLGFKDRDIALEDCIIVARTERRTIGLWVDAIAGIEEYEESSIVTHNKYLQPDELERPSIKGCIRLEDGLLVVQDLESLISEQEEVLLKDALAELTSGERL
jgi:purine-binding chemotaxis protein CheW